MFNKLKEKLGSFFSKKEKIEEKEPEKKVEKVKEKKKVEGKKLEGKKPELVKEEEKQEEDEKKKIQVESIKEPVKSLDSSIKKEESLKKENIQELDQAIEEVEEKIEEEEELDLPKRGFLERIRNKIGTTRLSQETFDEFFEELESMLLENNVALDVVDKIKEDMQKDLVESEIKKSEIEEQIKKSLKNSINNILIEPFDILRKIRFKEDPYVILFFGINGAGKTTTIAKVANYLKKNKITTIIAAADTFRAASIEQLETHGNRLGVKIISHKYGADPAAVGYDAIASAKAQGVQCVLIDTAGRMHTKSDLMREMEKIIRVCKPDLKIFVAESITGNDAVEQATSFNETFGIDGSILTKTDVDERGGTMISVGYVTGKPILFLGTGQEYKDLEPFSKNEILSNLGLN